MSDAKKKDDEPVKADAKANAEPATLEDRKEAVKAGKDATPVHDVTIPGGKYLVGGRLVNANGEPIKDDGSPVETK